MRRWLAVVATRTEQGPEVGVLHARSMAELAADGRAIAELTTDKSRWPRPRRIPPSRPRIAVNGARGGALLLVPRAPTVEKKTRKEDRRDETNLSPQWRFHAITNVLETTLIHFIAMKSFPSLSFQFHAKITFYLMWHPI